MPTSCVICGSAQRRVVFCEFGVDVVTCTDCTHVYSTHDTPRDYDGYFGADALNPAHQAYWDEAHRPMYDAFVRRHLDRRPPGMLMDVGCGLGFFARHVATERPVWKVLGVELSPVAVRFAVSSLGLSAFAGEASPGKPAIFGGRLEDAPIAGGSISVVTMWDVIEHLADPDGMLGAVRHALEPGGLLFLHTPNAAIQIPKAKARKALRGMRPELHYLEARDHLNLYTQATMTRLLERAGFRSVRFVHLPPIQSVSGARARMGVLVKNGWARSASAVHAMTAGRVNLDNLFVTATT